MIGFFTKLNIFKCLSFILKLSFLYVFKCLFVFKNLSVYLLCEAVNAKSDSQASGKCQEPLLESICCSGFNHKLWKAAPVYATRQWSPA